MKSAVRVLEVLEHFASVRREAGAAEIAQALGYPLSSTLALLRSMAERGYLVQGARRAWRPTSRVALLGAWTAPGLTTDGTVIRIMEHLGRSTGETIVLATASSGHARYVHVVPASNPVRMHVTAGTTRPLAESGAGRVLLAGMPEEAVEQALRRYEAEREPGRPTISPIALRRELQAIRINGHAVTCDRVTPGAGMVAAPVPSDAAGEPMAIGIGGPSQVIRVRAGEFAGLIKDTIGRYLGASA